ncbi:hypothetical protein OB2597_10901 [Pseudooceanicola batsensis HTCC2597]|uniref:Uncharacterized protein n=1 Tax=Pseudooceanicola batsensis (strain ATCC BAA-863 / DSM 15984 / KCTC 12145 / HTCC2597) TaxID=252305 RepID=A3TVV0_PSEBH|nr:hypothetical protein [Pseudooceanicola batsensis]EAQ03746.1 hypothetical protein OB2597_10901 [Pseudooceanicola batsensis HTCC2597]
MAHENRVIRSVNFDGETLCVDIFQRPDGSYGFDEYRRDPEDGRGWYSIGLQGDRRFSSCSDAMEEALSVVGWLADAITDRR